MTGISEEAKVIEMKQNLHDEIEVFSKSDCVFRVQEYKKLHSFVRKSLSKGVNVYQDKGLDKAGWML